MSPSGDTFGIISRSNERFEKEKNGLMLHNDEVASKLKQLSQVFGEGDGHAKSKSSFVTLDMNLQD